jgi:hypothetical protein
MLYRPKKPMKTKTLLFALLILWTFAAFSQTKPVPEETPEQVQARAIQPEYALLYFSESWKNTFVRITYPNGTKEVDAKRYTRSESHLIGDYTWLMPYLNKLTFDGYTLKSHSVTVRIGETIDSWQHVYVFTRDSETTAAKSTNARAISE